MTKKEKLRIIENYTKNFRINQLDDGMMYGVIKCDHCLKDSGDARSADEVVDISYDIIRQSVLYAVAEIEGSTNG